VGQANLAHGGASVAEARHVCQQSVTDELIGLRSPTHGLRDLEPPYGEQSLTL
jgi:hypothetical protein